MVGMQASLQPEREDSLRDLMKSDDDPMGTFDEVNDLNDDFNPDALLMEPLFNDSAGKLDQSFSQENEFGQFDEPHDTLLGRPDRTPVPPPAMEYSDPAKRPARPAIVRESRNVKLPSVSSMMMNGNRMSNRMANQPQEQPPHQQQQQAPPHQPLHSSFAGYNTGLQRGGGVPSVIGGMATQVTDDSVSHFDQSQSDMQDYSMQSYRSPTRRMSDRPASSNSSYGSDSPVMGKSLTPNMYGGGQPSMLTPARALPPKAQSFGGALMGTTTQSNDLSMMRQQLQRMRDLDIRDTNNPQTSESSNLTSQSMHLPVQRTTSASAALSRSMHFEPGQGSFSTMSGGSPFGNNVSIASDARSFKPSFNQMDGASMAGTSNVNEAMEKLCESMKRSAMSRSMVKQYSSGRGVSRHGSGQLYAMRQAAGHSSRNSMDDSSGRRAPVRRLSSTKHHLQHPVRGVNRHDSAKSAHSMNLQINVDGRYMGPL